MVSIGAVRGDAWYPLAQRLRHSETVVAVFLGLDLAEQRFMNLWFHKRVYYVCKIESACVRDVNPKPGRTGKEAASWSPGALVVRRFHKVLYHFSACSSGQARSRWHSAL